MQVGSCCTCTCCLLFCLWVVKPSTASSTAVPTALVELSSSDSCVLVMLHVELTTLGLCKWQVGMGLVPAICCTRSNPQHLAWLRES